MHNEDNNTLSPLYKTTGSVKYTPFERASQLSLNDQLIVERRRTSRRTVYEKGVDIVFSQFKPAKIFSNIGVIFSV